MQDADAVVTRLVEISSAMTGHTQSIAELAAERQRLLVELHDDLGWSDSAIAQVLGLSRAAVQKARAGR